MEQPSTKIVCPLTNDASFENKKVTTFAISDGDAILLSADRLSKFFLIISAFVLTPVRRKALKLSRF